MSCGHSECLWGLSTSYVYQQLTLLEMSTLFWPRYLKYHEHLFINIEAVLANLVPIMGVLVCVLSMAAVFLGFLWSCMEKNKSPRFGFESWYQSFSCHTKFIVTITWGIKRHWMKNFKGNFQMERKIFKENTQESVSQIPKLTTCNLSPYPAILSEVRDFSSRRQSRPCACKLPIKL